MFIGICGNVEVEGRDEWLGMRALLFLFFFF